MPRIALIALGLALFFAPALARSAEPCGGQLRAFNIYEVMEEGKIEKRHALFPAMDWSDASAFHGIVSPKPGLTLEVELEGRSRQYALSPWGRDPEYFVAAGFEAKKFFSNAESGSFFILRLKEKERAVCEERHEISGD